MNRVNMTAFRFVVLFIVSFACFAAAFAQDAKPTPAPQNNNPFAPQPAPVLPAGMTGANTNDPRASLKPGMYDAGETASGLRLVNMLKKPEAFALPNDPNDPKVDRGVSIIAGDPKQIPPPMKLVIAGLAFANSDMAFQGNRLFQGNFYGMNIYDIADPSKTRLLTSIICPGGQGDVSVYKNLMFMSVEMPNGRLDCSTEGFPVQTTPGLPAASKDRFRGVRIFDISDISNPKQVAAVQTCRGSHTHTLVTDPNDKNNVYIYVSGTSFVRQEEELAGCSGGSPDKNPNTAQFRIEVIKVPVKAPQEAKIVSSPRIFMDARTGVINSLSGTAHDAKAPNVTDQCHDITAYSAIGLAAGACSGNGIILDIKDPANPKRIDAVNDPNYSYWHSASFSNDGKKVVFTDEWGGGLGARCRATDPNVWGADSIFHLEGGKLKFASYYKMPSAQGDTENCVAHNGSIVPVPGRDIMVQAWYQGGISVMDFTDADHPKEIAYFDRGPIDPNMLVLGGSWSAYWYNGHIYSSEISRGLDIFELVPSQFLSKNEIDAARSVRVSELNVQNQQKIVWPKNKSAALAYIDQLERSQALSSYEIANLRRAVEAKRLNQVEIAGLKEMLEKNALYAKSKADKSRLHALAEILNQPEA
ncbi:MAG: hypothetical protein DMF62_05765 [Acidobacteria bacterium]|nr:MAG: hypothetical protein DMF62_05765 [Acidobacteriota bacterium]